MAIINGRGRVGIRKPSAAATPSIILDGLKLYLDAGKTTSYAGTGTVWTDLSGNGNNGTITSGVTYSSANGGSLVFNGGHVFSNYIVTSASTVTVWFNQFSLLSRGLLETTDGGVGSGSPNLYITVNAGDLRTYAYSASSQYSSISSYLANTWYCITVTRTPTSETTYLNGVVKLSNKSLAWVSNSRLNIGIGFAGSFNGNISNVQVYNRALSAAEVLQNYNALATRFLPLTYTIVADGLKAHLDAGNVLSYYGAGTVWKDLSGNSNNAALTNGPAYSNADSGAITLDGIDDSIVIPNSAAFPSSAGSWSIWAYYSSSTNRMTLIQRHSSQSASGIIVTVNGTSDSVSMQIYSSNVSQSVLSIGTSAAALNKNRWNNITVTFDSTNPASVYVNGVLSASGTPTGAWSFNNQSITLGTSPDSFWAKYAGKVSNIQIYNRALTSAEVSQNYSALLSRFYPVVSDSNAQAFVVAAGLTSSVQANAVNTLVTSMKSAGIWTKMKAVYPFVGGSAASHKWNLKDPRDLDAAFRLAFTAGWVHSSTGALPNGTSDYSNTNINCFSVFNPNSTSVSFYLRTDGLAAGLRAHGATDQNSSTDKKFHFFPKYTGNLAVIHISNQTTGASATSSDSRGYFVGSRTSVSNIFLSKNGLTLGSDTNSFSCVMPNISYHIGAMKDLTSYRWYDGREISFIHLGDGLTDTEASNLYTAVQAYQTSLGRQV